MKRLALTIVLAALLVAVCVKGQNQRSVYAVGFYNQENLFDTCHDAGKDDNEFLPTGSYLWTSQKYESKLRNMARVLAEMGTDELPEVGCAVIGLAEVENSKVLDDLTAQPALRERGYRYAHVEGPDERGIDCALLYNPSVFSVDSVSLLPYMVAETTDSLFVTRGFLTVDGTLAGERFTFIVCHWPSRRSVSAYRERAAEQVKAIKDSLLCADPDVKVVVMGDMNDDPTDTSMVEVLGAKAEIAGVSDGDMYNPWYNVLAKMGEGTLSYQGKWNLFDQIVMTPNMLNRNGNQDFSTLKYWKNQIFRRDYLLNADGKYKGTPKRTHSGGVWQDGFSDHLPVVVYLVREE